MTTENRELHPVGAQRSEERSWSWAGRCIYFEKRFEFFPQFFCCIFIFCFSDLFLLL